MSLNPLSSLADEGEIRQFLILIILVEVVKETAVKLRRAEGERL